ncbi:sigma factor SigA [Seminavis robusta]|uniref:Sigma factor SigA n=1 Tax=Seminavis robusta TaxID=568900 RepID=A0A9N8DTY2_9STRA|nr:sigma factor SigA [Seminavis robusta]|eukprot:Sro341_g121350.1 sigma factor SigA (483) ;mRNA; f:10251-11699
MPSTSKNVMKRNRLGVLMVAASLASLPTAMGMVTTASRAPTKSKLKVKVGSKVSTIPTEEATRRSQRIPKNPLQYYEGYASEDEDEELLSSVLFRENVDSVKKLQRSTKSEILNDELRQQIDSAVATSPDMFLDAHVENASMMEKVAMSSIPQQLPRPAIDAFNYGADRVSHEQELELGRMIQRGVALHKLKADFESKEKREISRWEWTELAELDSPKELRKQVSAYRQAKQLLVSANMGLVHAVVKKQYHTIRRLSGLSKEELIQEGSLGLLRAAELFDPSRGLRFSTYATIWIKGTLQNSHISDGSITLPQREKTKWNKIVKAHAELKKLKGEPTVEEIAHHLGMKVGEVLSTKKKMSQAQQVMSLDYEYATQTRSGTETGSQNKMENDAAFRADADLAERTQMHADVVATMARNLDAREARLMRLRYGLGDGKTRSLRECAQAMGLSETRTQQLAKQCLKKLREAAEAESLEEYLLTVA